MFEFKDRSIPIQDRAEVVRRVIGVLIREEVQGYGRRKKEEQARKLRESITGLLNVYRGGVVNLEDWETKEIALMAFKGGNCSWYMRKIGGEDELSLCAYFTEKDDYRPSRYRVTTNTDRPVLQPIIDGNILENTEIYVDHRDYVVDCLGYNPDDLRRANLFRNDLIDVIAHQKAVVRRR